ncbi:MAG: hypothetical protein HDR34_01760 [Treponema sp.]|nr:hypothetical protein [Treponema sp.]
MLSEIESMAEKMGLSIKSIVIDEDGLDIRLKAAGNAGKALPRPSRAQQVGDRIRIDSIDVDECEIDGECFNVLHLKDVEAILVDVGDGKTFLFEDILFLHDIDAKESGKPFPETPLGKYLAGPFRKALENRLGADLRDVFLLSYDNVFNDKSKDYMPFFEKQTHRIKIFENDTWWWLGTPIASNAATGFCGVGSDGRSGDYNARHSDGGVAPAFRIA